MSANIRLFLLTILGILLISFLMYLGQSPETPVKITGPTTAPTETPTPATAFTPFPTIQGQ